MLSGTVLDLAEMEKIRKKFAQAFPPCLLIPSSSLL
jgi:hypothetical protein